MSRRVVVIGAGIVGISVARDLAGRGVEVTVLERDAEEPRGSTALAPGFVGVYNDAPILTELARASTGVYDAVGHGFRRSGGLELATSDAGIVEVERRVGAARAAGLRAELLDGADVPTSVGSFVDRECVWAAGLHPDDGSADVRALTSSLREEARARGARFLEGAEATGVDARSTGVTVVTGSGDRFTANDVVLGGGVWGPSLAALTGLDLPLFPVAHPYIYDRARGGWEAGPFVRWPEHHVYARVHGDRLGIGSYDHRPIPVGQAELAEGAALAWSAELDPAVETAQLLLRPEVRFTPERRVNGVFAMTPDNLPFVGRHPDAGDVWIAQALWVTHAAGAAGLLAAAMTGEQELPRELDVTRFDGADPATLRGSALRLYRDIYASDG